MHYSQHNGSFASVWITNIKYWSTGKLISLKGSKGERLLLLHSSMGPLKQAVENPVEIMDLDTKQAERKGVCNLHILL